MSLQEVNADTAQHILRYLGGRDAASVAQTCKLFAAEVRKNLYIVVDEHVIRPVKLEVWNPLYM